MKRTTTIATMLLLVMVFGLVIHIQGLHYDLAENEATLIRLELKLDNLNEELIKVKTSVRDVKIDLSEVETYQDDLDITKEQMYKLEDEMSQLWWCIEELNKIVY